MIQPNVLKQPMWKKLGNQNPSSVKVIKGFKRNLGLKSFGEQSDYKIGRNVAFLLCSKEGWEIIKYFGGNLPDNALEKVIKMEKKSNIWSL